jgi:hypothetical protein
MEHVVTKQFALDHSARAAPSSTPYEQAHYFGSVFCHIPSMLANFSLRAKRKMLFHKAVEKCFLIYDQFCITKFDLRLVLLVGITFAFYSNA